MEVRCEGDDVVELAEINHIALFLNYNTKVRIIQHMCRFFIRIKTGVLGQQLYHCHNLFNLYNHPLRGLVETN